MVGLEDGIFLLKDIMDLFVSVKAPSKKVHNITHNDKLMKKSICFNDLSVTISVTFSLSQSLNIKLS